MSPPTSTGYLPTTRRQYERDPDAFVALVEERIGYPCFTKFANSGSSVGTTKAHNRAELVELPPGMAPRSMGELREYLRSVEGLQVTPAAREGMRTIFFPPMPLALRRNYSSQTLADNQFGYGWKLSMMPYLSLSKNSTQASNAPN